jgi:hypothetical protein
MTSIIKVDTIQDQDGNNIINENANTITIGASGDTITIPAGATFDASASTTTLPDDSVTTAKIVDANVTLAKLSATGTKDATTFLRGDNTFAEAGGGLVLQVVTATTSTSVTQTASSYTTSGLSASITPASISNKVLVITSSAISAFGDGSSSSGRNAPVGLFRGTVSDTKIQEHTSGLSMISASTSTNFRSYNTVSFVVLDSPSTTSAQTYTVGISGDGSTDIQAQSNSNISTITLMEIAG